MDKKQWLLSYIPLQRLVKEQEEEIERIRMLKINPSIKYSDMPKGTNQSDLSDYIVQLDSALSVLLKRKAEYEKRRCAIRKSIYEIDDVEMQEVLILRYLEGKEYWQIRQIMHYEKSKIYELRKKALERLVVDETI